MGYIGRKIGKSQLSGDTPGADAGAGGGILDLFSQGYFQRINKITDEDLLISHTEASGGVISDYTDPGSGNIYRAHIFTSSGTFSVTSVGSVSDQAEYLVVAGGGGGGGPQGGGGGAGGVRTNLSGHPLSTNNPSFQIGSGGTYSVTIGAGGQGGIGNNPNPIAAGQVGNPSVLAHPSTPITALAGGGGGAYSSAAATAGGSGGGGGRSPGTNPGGSGSFSGSPANPQPYRQGYPGGTAQPGYSQPFSGGGGGGAGGAGTAVENATVGKGGLGVQVLIAGPPTHTGVGATGPSSPYGQWYAGGGGGGSNQGATDVRAGGGGADNVPGNNPTTGYSFAGGGPGGGGAPDNQRGGDGLANTGGGGGGSSHTPGGDQGAHGGSGIVIVRYVIGSMTATAKASGGNVSFYGGKTIHTFYSSGQFICPGPFSETCEYVVIGGGGSGGSGSENANSGGAGGGAGTYRTSSVAITSGTYNVTIGAGGGRNTKANHGSQGGTTTLALPSSVASPGGGTGYPNPSPSYGGGSVGGTITENASPFLTGAPFPGTIGATPSSGWGHNGNYSPSVPAYNAGGGGGAGGAAPPQPGANLSPGGIGIQIPSTFRNPVSTVGAPGPTSPSVTGADNSGKFYVAGGGGGAAGHPQPAQPKGGDGGYGGGGNGGGISPDGDSYTGSGSDAVSNTGSGGGGGPTGDTTFAGAGGSGLVLIAYPS